MMKKLQGLGAFKEVWEGDPEIEGMTPVDTMWAGRDKIKSDGTRDALAARCVLRGDLHSKTYKVTANDTFSPVVRTPSLMVLEAAAMLQNWGYVSWDVSGAYLQGKQRPNEQVLARPPLGYRQTDERGKKLYWLMCSPLYG